MRSVYIYASHKTVLDMRIWLISNNIDDQFFFKNYIRFWGDHYSFKFDIDEDQYFYFLLTWNEYIVK